MACLVVVLGGILVACIDGAPSVEPGPGVQAGTGVGRQRWSLVFDDEFDGPTLDPAKWQSGRFGATSEADAPYNPRLEGAYFSSSGVTITDGNLNLVLHPSVRTIDGTTYTYRSGEVNTNGRFYLKPGMYVEARVKVPRCAGCWPAFWAVPKTQYPPELDIFEYFDTSIPSRSQPRFNFHPAGGGETGPTPYGERGVDYRDGYHVYGMYWTGSEAIAYLDGRPYDVGVRATTSLPEYLILNLSMYAHRTPPDGSQMSVDWVRAWQPQGPSTAAH
ncbi:MAG: glycoside hydrolase family 16 protein [Intrasporangium sp.]|uniref:glycoside hydrolase family 16 protein n=1 Tax=Intrasporangium sp. TaxID=1925024 RepID=UPI003F7E710F